MALAETPLIELRGVARRFGPTVALEATDLTIERGKTTLLIGPSGCGKSTLLRMIIGLTGLDAGSILFAGTPLATKDMRELRHRMGYVIQEGGLFPHLTAFENVALLARHLGREVPWVVQRIGELASLTHFPHDGLERYPSQLSGGQRQRVSLMRALMLDPEVLLLDEPLGALDPMIRSELQEDLRSIFRTLKKTVVMVTHDLAEAEYFSDKVVLMSQGRIEQQGPFKDLLQHPASEFVTRFVRAQRLVQGQVQQC